VLAREEVPSKNVGYAHDRVVSNGCDRCLPL